ncbi:hypothetical protein [Haloferula sp. BvORR071]|uniref:hypothetical protein n=1 Tax=Haloferula sp. BvORR071 TaxID=1396141 RepID=UPI000557506C|nr:hypothetical protein [Haloferula sp. BvORR071]
MKRRSILLCVFFLLLAIPLVGRLSRGDGDSAAARSGEGSPGGQSPSAANDAGKDSRSGDRGPVDYSAKAASMLELKAGELGVLPIKADLVDDVFGGNTGPKDVPLLRGLIHKQVAKELLEKALKQGNSVQVKIGEGKQGVDWKVAEFGVKASLGGDREGEGFPDLLVESSPECGEVTKQSVTIATGTCALVRYPSGESLLIVIGGGFPIGGLMKEEP